MRDARSFEIGRTNNAGRCRDKAATLQAAAGARDYPVSHRVNHVGNEDEESRPVMLANAQNCLFAVRVKH